MYIKPTLLDKEADILLRASVSPPGNLIFIPPERESSSSVGTCVLCSDQKLPSGSLPTRIYGNHHCVDLL